MYRETLASLRARIRHYRPDLSAAVIDRLINDRVREVIDSRLYWTDLLRSKTVCTAGEVSAGTVTLSRGAQVVSGDGTSWPVSDIYSGQVVEDVAGEGYLRITVEPEPDPDALMGRWAVIGTGADQEICPVVSVDGSRMVVKSRKPKTTGQAVLVSSLSGRRFRAATSYGWHVVMAVTSPSELHLCNPWTGPSGSGVTYRIVDSLIRMPPDTKTVLDAVDLTYGTRLTICHSVREGIGFDPRREQVGSTPLALIEYDTDPTGVIVYELWPAPSSPWEIRIVYASYWPRLVNDNDPLPWFIEPAVFAYGVIADALRFKRGSEDIYFDPGLAREFEQKYLYHLALAKDADEQKAVKDYMTVFQRAYGASSEFWQKTEPEILDWEF